MVPVLLVDGEIVTEADVRALKEAVALADKNYLRVVKENQRLRAALQRLADCDWVITPADRMDAVRAIAREALGDS